MLEFRFDLTENHLTEKLSDCLDFLFGGRKPIIICIGTDLSIGDSLGPLIGTMLKEKGLNAFVYGRLSETITAKEIKAIKNFVEKSHPSAKTLVIDAAIGDEDDVGSIKISLAPIRPGLGANKNLPEIGTATIIGIVAKRSCANYSFLNLTRLSPVYRMARCIADGIEEYFDKTEGKQKNKYFNVN